MDIHGQAYKNKMSFIARNKVVARDVGFFFFFTKKSSFVLFVKYNKAKA